MKLAAWPDGYVLDTDPRREDPLYYYLREGGWGSAVGIEVAPLYEEHGATEVIVRVWSGHRSREAALDPAARRSMYARVLAVLLRRFPKWSVVTLQSGHLPELARDEWISAVLAEAGFSRGVSAGDEERWTRN